jgi:hypothetical protein
MGATKKKTSAILACLALAAALGTALAADAKAGSWTGFITDSHCGKAAASKDHDADCVEKCVKGGATAQLVSDADGKTYALDGWDKVKGLVGVRVTLTGSLDEKSAVIKVASAQKAAN